MLFVHLMSVHEALGSASLTKWLEVSLLKACYLSGVVVALIVVLCSLQNPFQFCWRKMRFFRDWLVAVIKL